jgi:hypothetical protein
MADVGRHRLLAAKPTAAPIETLRQFAPMLRDYRVADAAAVNRVALAAFTQFRDAYADWPAMAANVGNMAGLAGAGEIVVAERDGAVVGAVAYIRRIGRRPAISTRRGRSFACSSSIPRSAATAWGARSPRNASAAPDATARR